MGCWTTTSFADSWLSDVGRPGFVVADDIDVPARRDAQLDLMADLLIAHVDLDAITGLLEHGAPDRPTIVTSA